MTWAESLDSLTIWAVQKGYHVEFVKNGDDSVCYISKIIEVNSSSSLEKQVIHMAHECGHVLIFEHGSKFNFKDRRNEPTGTVSHKVFTLIEEVEAWKRGRDLINRLKIPIDDTLWEKSMVKALKKYINWASDLKGK